MSGSIVRRFVWGGLFAGLSVALLACGSAGDQRVQADAPVGTTALPLDAYVGFGRSPSAARRDDTVALWEAYEREQSVVGCMKTAGFAYASDPAFPDHAIRGVAQGLGVKPGATSSADATAANQRTSGALARVDRDRYYRTLLGESLATVEAVETDAEEAAPSDSYATGGCVGRASDAVPGVWDARRSLQDELLALDERIGAALAGPYGECVRRASGLTAAEPGALEQLAISVDPTSATRRKAEAALASCSPTWDDGFRSRQQAEMPGFIAEHRVVFDGVQRRYAGVTDRISADQGFRSYLARVIVA